MKIPSTFRFFKSTRSKDLFQPVFLRNFTEGPLNSLKQEPFHARTHYCGVLRKENVGEEVVLSGWALRPRRLGDSLIFLPIRDRSGVVQLVFLNDSLILSSFDNEFFFFSETIEIQFRKSKSELFSKIESISSETVVNVKGKVRARPDVMNNNEMETGEIEVEIESLDILNRAENLPFQINEKSTLSNESLRLKYRYLDLRRKQMYRNLKMRSIAAHATREYLIQNDFLEIETPTLFKHTPEGAREFIVPTRNHNKFYALPQSPQQYKQLLMSGGIDRYFQLAKCYRDEDSRADRQPEFTQIDLEMSFVTQEEIQNLIEGLVKAIWKATKNIDLVLPFPKMDYATAISKYGSDKPDTRFGLEIQDVTDLFNSSNIESEFKKLTQRGGKVNFIKIPQGRTFLTNKSFEKIQNFLGEVSIPKNHFKVAKLTKDFEWNNPFAFEDKKTLQEIEKRADFKPEDILFFLGEEKAYNPSSTGMGKLRLFTSELLQSLGKLTLDPTQLNFLWVENFPLFTPIEKNQNRKFDDPENKIVEHFGIESTHHPFTSPKPEDIEHLIQFQDKSPEEKLESIMKISGLHYDLVLNGSEIGGGSIRIHSPQLQLFILKEILKLPEKEINRFNHLLDALKFGCPPHGGIALGFDRLMVLLCEEKSLRDVIAFPKSIGGNELMVDSPSNVSPSILKDYHIQILENKEGN